MGQVLSVALALDSLWVTGSWVLGNVTSSSFPLLVERSVMYSPEEAGPEGPSCAQGRYDNIRRYIDKKKPPNPTKNHWKFRARGHFSGIGQVVGEQSRLHGGEWDGHLS